MLLLLARNNKPDKIIEKKNSFETEENILSYVKKISLSKITFNPFKKIQFKIVKKKLNESKLVFF